ncbi:nonribosomal peptide synthetase MxaA [Methylocella sp.]|uniref:nonribosomal peptide synthetase MxaA n=1 Tax=Methylocella sp. TaxID=1978226 RepID=UPI0035B037BC
MRRGGALLFALAALAAAASAAKAQIVSIERAEPRPFGHFLGDTLDFDILVEVDPAYRLDLASAPQPGPVTYWLDLRSVRIDDEGGSPRRVRLRLDYQNFYAALDARQMVVPGFDLTFRSGDKTALAQVAPFSFVISSLREAQPDASDPDALLRPDPPAPRKDLAPLRRAFGGCLALASLALGLVAFDRAWPPFQKRPARPFAQAARRLARENGAQADPAAFKVMHQAMDAASGGRLLEEDLGGFLERRPEFSDERAAFERFFDASRRMFYAGGEAARNLFGLDELRAFARRLAAIERGAK